MQLNHIRRAKEAGVKLFIPCDYALEFASQETSAHDKGKVYTNEDMESERYGGLVVEVYAAPHDPLATHFQSRNTPLQSSSSHEGLTNSPRQAPARSGRSMQGTRTALPAGLPGDRARELPR